MACSMLNGLIISKLKEIKNHIARYLWSFLQTDGIEAAELSLNSSRFFEENAPYKFFLKRDSLQS